MPELTVSRLAQMYGIPIIDWGRPDGDSLLLTTGAGLMMATCDVIGRIRWAADLGGGVSYPGLGSFLTWANRYVPGLVIGHFWFSVSNPEQMRQALAEVEPHKLRVRSNVPLGLSHETPTFRELIRVCADRVRLPLGFGEEWV